MEPLYLSPVRNVLQARRSWQGRYLSVADYQHWVKQDTIGLLPSEESAFVFLRNAIGPPRALCDLYHNLRRLPFIDVGHSARQTALRGSSGGEYVLGWLADARNGIVSHPCPAWLLPLLRSMGLLLRLHLPEVWQQQRARARENGTCLLTPVFSTLTINRNALFRSHSDHNNASSFSCLTTFGDFAGGELCLPRLRVAFPLRPGDLLIMDSQEQHGSLDWLRPDRISVVAYLRRINKPPPARAM